MLRVSVPRRVKATEDLICQRIKGSAWCCFNNFTTKRDYSKPYQHSILWNNLVKQEKSGSACHRDSIVQNRIDLKQESFKYSALSRLTSISLLILFTFAFTSMSFACV